MPINLVNEGRAATAGEPGITVLQSVRLVLNERSGEVFGNAPGCAEGFVDLGTGD